jgi:hypothetical protein
MDKVKKKKKKYKYNEQPTLISPYRKNRDLMSLKMVTLGVGVRVSNRGGTIYSQVKYQDKTPLNNEQTLKQRRTGM